MNSQNENLEETHTQPNQDSIIWPPMIPEQQYYRFDTWCKEPMPKVYQPKMRKLEEKDLA
jgi:hypothetical protein